MIKKTSIKKYIDFYRNEYEDYMNVNSNDTTYKYFTLEEQIERYSKHYSFWLIKKDELKHNNYKDKNNREKFIQMEIVRTLNTIQNMFPNDVVLKINCLAISKIK